MYLIVNYVGVFIDNNEKLNAYDCMALRRYFMSFR